MMDELTFTCPVCGADVPRRAKACPECGACEKSGWSEDHYLDGIDLPEDPATLPGRTPSGHGRQRLWQIVALIVLLAFVWMMLSGRW